jgi:hypothetical protein
MGSIDRDMRAVLFLSAKMALQHRVYGHFLRALVRIKSFCPIDPGNCP